MGLMLRTIVASACTITILVTACSEKKENVTEPVAVTLRVGALLPLTGDAAVYGKAIRNGIELARAQSKTPLDLVYEDDQGQAVASVSGARKLIDIDKVPVIIGGAMSSTAEAIIPICTQKQVVLLSPTATKPSLTHMGNYFLRLWPSDDYDGRIMANAAFDHLRLRRVAILYVNLAYGAGITDVFERDFTKRGGVIVGKEGYAQGSTDFRTTLTKLAAEKPDAIFLPGYVAEITQILKQASQLNLKTRFLGVNSMYDPKLIEVAGPAAEGAVFSYPTFDTKSSQPIIADFVKAYRAKFGSEPDAFAAQGYDTYMVLQKALSAGSARSGKDIARLLHGMGTYEGPGGRISFDASGDVQKPLRLLTVRDGKFVDEGSVLQ